MRKAGGPGFARGVEVVDTGLSEDDSDRGCKKALCGASVVKMSAVDPGKGEYAKVSEYALVGEGQGSWDKEVVEIPVKWRLRKCAMCFVVVFILLFAIGITCLLAAGIKSMFSGGGASTTHKVVSSVNGGCKGSNLSPSQKDHCCTFSSLSCPTTVSPNQFDCGKGRSSWKTAWSTAQKDWCCGFSRIQCAEKDLEFDCHEGSSHYKSGWSVDKKVFCCEKEQVGCPNAEEKGCEQACLFKKYNTKCGDRINWVRTHNTSRTGEACGWAHSSVTEECGDQCDGCTPQAMGCPAPDKCGGALRGHWSENKKADCCLAHEGLQGCKEAGYSCDKSDSKKWSKRQAEFCCKFDKRFCGLGETSQATSEKPTTSTQPTTTQAPTTTKAPTTITATITTTKAPTTTTDLGGPYDCIQGYSNWHHNWHVNKQKWCCERVKRGCGHDD